MRNIARLLLPAFLIVSPFSIGSTQGARQQDTSCDDVIHRAISVVGALKPGMTRGDVEKEFEEDGGLQSRLQTRYVYSRANYVKIEIRFKPVGSSDPFVMPGADVVTSVSKPYLEYPFAD